MTIHGGGQGRRYYRCDDQAKRGSCVNAASVREAFARERLLAGIRDTIMSKSAIAYVRKTLAKKISEVVRTGGKRTRRLRAELDATAARIENLVEAIAGGTPIQALRAKLEADDQHATRLRAELEQLEAVARQPIPLPSDDDAVRMVFELEKELEEGEVAANREALRRLLLGGTVRLVPDEDGIYTAHADVLLFGLFVGGSRRRATRTKQPASRVSGGRYLSIDCGGLLRRLCNEAAIPRR